MAKKFYNRFYEVVEIPTDISVPLKLGTVINDGGFKIVTGYGIYNNQYWCETLDNKEVVWGAGGYHRITNDGTIVTNDTIIKEIYQIYRQSFYDLYNRFFRDVYSVEQVESHLKILTKRKWISNVKEKERIYSN